MSGNFVTDDFIEALLGFKAGDPSLKVKDPEDEEKTAQESHASGSGASKNGTSFRDLALPHKAPSTRLIFAPKLPASDASPK